MALPLITVLSTAPGVISAATELIRMMRKRQVGKHESASPTDKLAELEAMLEKQAELIEKLAVNNRNLALAVRNNRIIAGLALLVAVLASGWMLLRL